MAREDPAEKAAPGCLSERHWRLLSLVAQQGELSTLQITTLMFNSRPSAARHLNVLVKAGLLWRYISHKGSSHVARYQITLEGTLALKRTLHQAGQHAPIGLGQRGIADRHRERINDFFVRLVRHARNTERGHLYRWRHALDTALWLRSLGIADAHPDGYGLWIEGDSTISFLLHIDRNKPSPQGTQPPSELLAGYRQTPTGVPVDAALILTPTNRREQELHRDLADAPAPLTVAATTYDRLAQAPSPADAIWSVTATPTSLVSLIDLAHDSGSHVAGGT